MGLKGVDIDYCILYEFIEIGIVLCTLLAHEIRRIHILLKCYIVFAYIYIYIYIEQVISTVINCLKC